MESKFIVPDVEIMKLKNSKKSEDWDQVGLIALMP